DHRHGALVGQRARGQLVDRRGVAVGELMEHEELCAADAEPRLRGPRRQAQRADDAPERIHHGAYVGTLVRQGATAVGSGHPVHPRILCYIGVNTSQRDGPSNAWQPMWCRRAASAVARERTRGVMHDNTSSLDEKLREKERAEEAVFFGKRDRALVKHLRETRDQTL